MGYFGCTRELVTVTSIYGCLPNAVSLEGGRKATEYGLLQDMNDSPVTWSDFLFPDSLEPTHEATTHARHVLLVDGATAPIATNPLALILIQSEVVESRAPDVQPPDVATRASPDASGRV